MRRGRFITFEGMDGAGKSTHLNAVAGWLRDRGLEVVVTREPGGSAVSEALRDLMLGSSMGPVTELLLAFAARAEHIDQRIEPALAAGHWVVSDRFTDSTYAYQAQGRGIGWSEVAWLETLVQKGLHPDLTLLFDLPPEIAAERRAKARHADRFEAEDLAFFERVRAGYLRRAQEHPKRIILIDAQKPPSDIENQLKNIILTI